MDDSLYKVAYKPSKMDYKPVKTVYNPYKVPYKPSEMAHNRVKMAYNISVVGSNPVKVGHNRAKSQHNHVNVVDNLCKVGKEGCGRDGRYRRSERTGLNVKKAAQPLQSGL